MEDKSINIASDIQAVVSAQHVMIKQRHPLSGRIVVLSLTHNDMQALIEGYENQIESS